LDKPSWDLATSIIKVLHIDDDEAQWEMLGTFVNQIDPKIQFTHVSNSEEALELIKKGSFNCIVTDYKLPGINGLDLTTEVRKINKIPVILYTGQGGEEIAEKAFMVGVDDYIRKEVNSGHYQLVAKRIKDIVDKNNIEQLYLKVVEDSRDAIAIIMDYKVVYANHALSDLLGYDTPNDLIGKPILDYFIPLEEKTNYEKRIEKRINDELPPLMEYNAKSKNGEKVIIETLTTKIKYNGRPALLVFSRDITERKKIEVTLKQSEERFRSLVNMAPDGIVTMDIKGKITYVNPSFLKLTGFDEAEIIGASILKLKTLRIKDVPAYTKLFTKLIFGEGNLDSPIEFIFKKKDGGEGIGEGRAQAVNVSGNGREILIVARDITERKKLEENLKVYSKELEKLAEEKSKKLIESEKLIVTGSIASSLGHDLRSPLNTIRNAIYLIQIHPEKTEEMLSMIDFSVDNSLKLLDELRERTKNFTLELEDVKIVDLFNEVWSETLVPPEISLRINVNSDALLRVDRAKMKRVFENLIRNSCEAMPKGGNLSISIYDDNSMVRIDFSDTGIGIPENVMRNLFKPFITTKENGTGLGLNFCKKMVDSHGGQIYVKSQEGKGTTFSILLNKLQVSQTLVSTRGQR
jgi:two-component system, sporulation sensor kinase A